MRQTDIADALRSHLAGLQPRPRIVFSNYAGASGPRWETRVIASPPTRNAGFIHTQRGRMIVAVLVPVDSGTQEAEDEAETIVARFPPDLSLPVGDGRVRLIQRPHVEWVGSDTGDEATNGTEYRMDVHVRWIAYDH